MALFRTYLSLGRATNLPTVWSNCLAGWWLGGDHDWQDFPLLLAVASCFYLGGTFLNDAFDANFDAQHRRGRPIPSQLVNSATVWRWGWAWLAAGLIGAAWLGKVALVVGLLLVMTILLYDAFHRLTLLSPALLGFCRFLLYVLGASIAAEGVTGWALWCGLALAIYLLGASLLKPDVEAGRAPSYWPVLLLLVPIALALLLNGSSTREAALLLSAISALWLVRCLRHAFWPADQNLSLVNPGVQAGIVLVDWLATADAPRSLGLIFIGLFLTTLFFQRLMPEGRTGA